MVRSCRTHDSQKCFSNENLDLDETDGDSFRSSVVRLCYLLSTSNVKTPLFPKNFVVECRVSSVERIENREY